MVNLTLRETGATPKGSPLSNAEIDQNFINLKNAVEAVPTEHSSLSGRLEEDQHPIAAISGLQTALNGKADVGHSHTLDAVVTAQGLTDPQADRILFWDDSANAHKYLEPDATLAITGTQLGVKAATTSQAGTMSASDKTKLDGIADGANNYIHPVTDGTLHLPETGTTNNGKVLKAGATAGSAAWGTLTASEVDAEPSVSVGTTDQYFRGDKTWRDLFTDVRAATLTGLSTATNVVISATDTVLAALGKLQAQVSAKQDTLISGTSIKTVNSTSLLGSGDITTGDVTGQASSVDSEIALFSGTGGKTVKRATGSGLAKLTSGVLSTASAGTDYVAPDTATNFTKPQRPSLSSEIAPSANAITWDLTTNQILQINLNANITTFNLTGTLSSLAGNQYQVLVRYNGGSSITWNANMKWTAGTTPTLTGTSGKVDVFTFVVGSTNGTNFYLINTGIKQNM